MNLTLQFVLLALVFFSIASVAFSRKTHRAKRRHCRFFRFQGIRFKLAAHYLPMNGTTSDKKLVDMRGNASAQAYNGVKTSTAEQLGEFLTLDGTDGVIELKNFEDRCIVDPTECMEGLSVAFWIRYAKGEFIISSGEYTSKNSGPGFRFICKNCTKNSSHAQSSRKFILELSTSQAKWEIHLDSIPCWWFHFAFTWSRNRGLKFYENGRLAVSSGDSIEVSSSGNHKKSFITIGKPNSLQSLMNSHGNLSIGHLVIWTHELTAFDMEVAFLTVPTKTTKSLICCEQMKGDPCVEKPYHDGHSCHGMADKHKCICTNSFNRVCSLEQKLAEECEDKTPQCQLLAKQENYCEHHWHRMKEQCPSACDFCGILTQVPGFSSTSMQLPLKVSSTFTSPSAVPILTTTVRPTIAQISTTLVSSTSTTRASSSFATSSVARMSTSLTNSAVARVSSLPASSSTVKINTKSTSSTPHVLFSRATTTSSLAQITSVQPMLSSSVPTHKKDTLRCKINNSTCICFNCEEALKNGKICCIGLIDIKNIQHGVTMNVTNITVKDFYSKVEAVSRIIGEVVRDSCRENASPCVTGKRFSHTRGKRRRRSPEENILKNYPSFDVVRTKREALSPDETPSMTNISHVVVIICGISSKAGHPSNVQTDFYVTVTSITNGSNQTAVIDGKGLLQILRDNKRTLEDKLNITIDSFAASQKPEKRATTTSPHSTLVPNPSSGSPNMQSPSSSREVAAVPTTAVDGRSVEDGKKQGISQGLLILIICVGCAGVVLMIVVMAFILTRFYKQRKGEFVPDKSYPNSHNKQNGNVSMEDAETYSTSIIDPSTPRITDVPHKPTRAQAVWGGAGGAKKQKKPMGVKVTYKPPEWD